MIAVTEFESPEAEAKALAMLTLEERIEWRKRQFGSRVRAQQEALAQALEVEQARLAAERAEKTRLQKQRQAANHAARVANNQRIRNDRNSNRK